MASLQPVIMRVSLGVYPKGVISGENKRDKNIVVRLREREGMVFR